MFSRRDPSGALIAANLQKVMKKVGRGNTENNGSATFFGGEGWKLSVIMEIHDRFLTF